LRSKLRNAIDLDLLSQFRESHPDEALKTPLAGRDDPPCTVCRSDREAADG
jgi:hypothetical protein